MEILMFIVGAIFGASICGLFLFRSFKKTNDAVLEKVDTILKRHSDEC